MEVRAGIAALLLMALMPLQNARSATPEPPHSDEQGPVLADPRPPRESTFAEDLLWVPRIVFFPLYLTSEFVIRRPLGWLLTTAEKNDWRLLFTNIFFFGENKNFGLLPTAFIHFNFRPSIGFYFFGNDAWAPGHQIRFYGSTGGERWWNLGLTDRWRLWKRHVFELQLSYLQRPDYIFHGIGPESLNSQGTRFLKQISRMQVQYAYHYYRSSHVDFRFTLEHDFLDPGQTTGRDPSLSEGVARGYFPVPPGPNRYTLLRGGIYSFFDNRIDHRKDGNGISGRLNLEFAQDVDRDLRWLTLTPRFAGHVDLGHNRILSLNLFAEHLFKLAAEPIPFSELSSGGIEPHILGGYWPGRLRGVSMLGTTLEYRYEIWALLDGTVFFTLGNTYGEAFEGLSWGSLRPSYGIGISNIGNPDSKFHFLLAFGHKTFSQGGGFDQAQLIFGYRPNL